MNRQELSNILRYARTTGYYIHNVSDWSYCLKWDSNSFGAVTFNLYWSKKSRLYTVQTTVKHPTKGKNQLNRKNLSVAEVKSLLINPRKHTGKGYRKTAKAEKKQLAIEFAEWIMENPNVEALYTPSQGYLSGTFKGWGFGLKELTTAQLLKEFIKSKNQK